MHSGDCPKNWQYEDHPDRAQFLPARCAEILLGLRRGTIGGAAAAVDSRPIHGFLFKGLTPSECSYFAGSYRGENYRCLRDYWVHIPTDPRVGAPPGRVQQEMALLEAELRACIAGLDAAHALPNAQTPSALKLATTLAVACRVLEWFLRIHPYANGNGHAARIIVIAILGRYGYWPTEWTIEPRPSSLPYYEMITQQRAGNPVVCEEALAHSL